jgi:glutathione S-transferase
MTLQLYFHPFSSYCQTVLTALCERDVPFEPRPVDLGDPEQRASLEALWPMGKFPVLRDEAADVTLAEATLIVEYLDRYGDSPPLVPAGRDEALAVRLWDRVFDLYVDLPLQTVVKNCFRPDGAGDPFGDEQAKALIRRAYAMADTELARTRAEWIAGETFALADCAAAPALFYANIVAPFAGHSRLEAYFERLLSRPSFARAVEQARPWRHLFPLPWPEGYA